MNPNLSRKTALVLIAVGALGTAFTASLSAQVITSGSLLVDLRSVDLTAGATTWINQSIDPASVGNFTFLPGSTDTQLNLTSINGVTALNIAGSANNSLASAGSSGLAGAATWSIEIWAYAPTLNLAATAVSFGHRDANIALLEYAGGASYSYSILGGTSMAAPTTQYPVGDNTLHLFSYVYNGSALTIYVDGGASSVTTTNKAVNLTSAPFQLGSDPAAGGTTGTTATGQRDIFNGSIATVRAQTGVLSPSDVAANYAAGPLATVPEPRLILLLGVGFGFVLLVRHRRSSLSNS